MVLYQLLVNLVVRDLFDDFYIWQVVGQVVVDIWFKVVDVGVVGGKDFVIVEQDYWWIFGQYFIQLVVDWFVLFDVEYCVVGVNQFIDFCVMVVGFFSFVVVEILYFVVWVVEGVGVE